MDHDGGSAGAMAGENFCDVGRIVGVGEALVVHDDIVGFGPVGIIVEFDLGAGSLAAFVDDGPRDVADLLYALGEGFGLKIIIVAAATGDEEGADGCGSFGGVGGAGERGGEGEEREEEREAGGFHGEMDWDCGSREGGNSQSEGPG
jgi:hypothetical protein